MLNEWQVAPTKHPVRDINFHKNGDGLLEESHMPTGWPLHIDGAVRQRCIHRDTALLELDDLLSEYDMKRDLAKINRKAPQWSHKAVLEQMAHGTEKQTIP